MYLQGTRSFHSHPQHHSIVLSKGPMNVFLLSFYNCVMSINNPPMKWHCGMFQWNAKTLWRMSDNHKLLQSKHEVSSKPSCSCNGQNAKCKRWKCVISGQRCTSCQPLKNSLCCNAVVPPSVPLSSATTSSQSFSALPRSILVHKTERNLAASHRPFSDHLRKFPSKL